MNKNLITLLTTAILIVGAFASAIPAFGASVTVDAGQDTYSSGQQLDASGTVSPVTTGQAVTIQVTGPAGFPGAFAVSTPNSDGTWSASAITTFITSYPAGTYTVKATYSGVTASKTVTFSSTGISVATVATSYRAGESVSVTGSVPALQTGYDVTIQLTGPAGFPGAFATATPSSDLSFTASDILTMSSSYPAGTYTVTASYYRSGSGSSTFEFNSSTRSSSLSIGNIVTTPSIAIVDKDYTISVTVSSNSTISSVVAGSTSLTQSGTTWAGTLTAPSTPGSYIVIVTATDAIKSVSKSTTVTVAISGVSLAPNFGVPGSTVTYNASNLEKKQSVTATLSFHGLDITLAKGTTDGNGKNSGVFKIPSVPSGVYTLTVTDSTGKSASTSLGVGVLLQAEASILVTGVSAVYAGDSATLYIIPTFNGAKVNPNFTVNNYFDPFLAKPVDLASPTKISDGFYSITFKAPTKPGTYGVHIEAKYESPDGRTVTGVGLTNFEVNSSQATDSINETLNETLGTINSSISSIESKIASSSSSLSSDIKSVASSVKSTNNNVDRLDASLDTVNEGISNATTFVLVVTALAAVTVVLNIVIIIRSERRD